MESREFSSSSEPRIPWRADSRSLQSGSEQYLSSPAELSGVVRLGDTGGKLYGRSQELGLLEDVFKRVVAEKQVQNDTATTSSIKHEIVLVSGESGAGKSTLVRTFRDGMRQYNEQRAFFVEGKFDQNQDAGRPYSAIADAITQLCHSIRESDYFEEIRESVQTSLSGEISVLLKLVPAIKVFTKGLALKNEQTERASSNYAFKLFMGTFRSFLKVVCQAHPLVIFLDDLQWADEASRQLILAITSDISITNFFFIGAFRDDEIDPSSILSWVGRPSETGVDVVNILVGPLDSDSVNKMVADLTERRIESTKELSELVGRKTGRNAYFLAQYMGALQRQGLLEFSFKSNRWEWDLDQIESRTDVSENVVGLLIGKIHGMAPDVQKVLMLASCLGFVFDVNALERIVISEELFKVNEEEAKQETLPESTSQKEKDSPEPYNDLKNTIQDTVEAEIREGFYKAVEEAVKQNLIEEAAAKFKFSHDRVQQAAYALMPSGDNSYLLHIRIGKVLLEMSEEIEEGEWLFFAGVDLLTKFASQASNEGLQVELARLSLEAGKKAELKSAFIPATNYLLGGIQLLDPTNRWTEHYELCLELHIKAAEVGRTYGDFHETLALVEEILAHGRCLKDKLRALLIKAYVLGGQNKLLEAIETCTGALKQLRIRLPSNPKTFHVLFEYARTKRLLKGRKAKDLLSLPRTSDEMEIEAIRFLNAASIFAWHADLESVASFVFLRMMRLTLKNGLCKFSPFAFATFGMLLAAIGEHKEGYEFGRVALELHDHLEGSRECIAATTVVVESCLTHLRKPLYDSLAPMLESHQIGMETGEIEFAALCLSGHGGMSIILGAKLESMETALRNYVPFFREYSQGMAEGLSAPWLQFTMNLQGKAVDPLVLTGDGMNEEEFIRYNTENKHMMAVRNVHLTKMVLLYIFGELEAADFSRQVWEEGTGAEGTHFMIYFIVLFSGLTCLGLARRYPKKRRHYLSPVRRYSKKMEKLVKDGDVNATLILRFLRAEKLALNGDLPDVKKAFDETISLAGRTGFRLIKALACERVGNYMLERREPLLAADYMQQAYFQFADYGATAKVKLMESHFNLLNFSRPLTGMAIASGGTSFHLQPKVAATDSHRRLNFSGVRTEFGDASESSGVQRRTSGLTLASGKTSLASGRSGISEDMSFSRSDYISEELSMANTSSGVSTSSPLDGLSLSLAS